jgi:hypothetical protein
LRCQKVVNDRLPFSSGGICYLATAKPTHLEIKGVHRLPFVAVLFVVLTFVLPAVARAEDPPYFGWSSLLSGTSSGFQPTSEDDCVAGREACIDKVIREMDRRFRPLAESCDHDAIFALGYLRTTEEYRRAIQDPDFFEDTAFVNHEDAVFAAYYVDAYDAWHSGDRARTPPAWQVAFHAADTKSLPASGNLVLGVNAHIQADLPFVLAGIGLVKPDGSSRKRDHDKVNEFLNRVTDDMIPEMARRFDPSIDDGDLPTFVDDVLTFQSIALWREIAWRNAERLVAAPDAAARARVAEEIHAYAASQARLLASATRYSLLESSAGRDRYCASVDQG